MSDFSIRLLAHLDYKHVQYVQKATGSNYGIIIQNPPDPIYSPVSDFKKFLILLFFK